MNLLEQAEKAGYIKHLNGYKKQGLVDFIIEPIEDEKEKLQYESLYKVTVMNTNNGYRSPKLGPLGFYIFGLGDKVTNIEDLENYIKRTY